MAAVFSLITFLAMAPADLTLFIQGPRGDTCSGQELPLLHEGTALPGVEIEFGESGIGILQRGRDIVFSPKKFGDLLEVAGAIESGELELLADEVPVALGEEGLSFQWPLEGLPNLVEV